MIITAQSYKGDFVGRTSFEGRVTEDGVVAVEVVNEVAIRWREALANNLW